MFFSARTPENARGTISPRRTQKKEGREVPALSRAGTRSELDVEHGIELLEFLLDLFNPLPDIQHPDYFGELAVNAGEARAGDPRQVVDVLLGRQLLELLVKVLFGEVEPWK